MRFARVRRSAWGRLMHDVLFACHARLDVHKYDSALRRFVSISQFREKTKKL